MSRTYRRDAVDLDINDRPFPYGMKWSDYPEYYWHRSKYDYYSKRNSKQDHKSYRKSPSIWKKIMAKGRKSKVRQAMARHDYDNVPRFRKENDRDWN